MNNIFEEWISYSEPQFTAQSGEQEKERSIRVSAKSEF